MRRDRGWTIVHSKQHHTKTPLAIAILNTTTPLDLSSKYSTTANLDTQDDLYVMESWPFHDQQRHKVCESKKLLPLLAL
jgi:hypothetical protein